MKKLIIILIVTILSFYQNISFGDAIIPEEMLFEQEVIKNPCKYVKKTYEEIEKKMEISNEGCEPGTENGCARLENNYDYRLNDLCIESEPSIDIEELVKTNNNRYLLLKSSIIIITLIMLYFIIKFNKKRKLKNIDDNSKNINSK